MTSVTEAMKAKSDQLNYVDLGGREMALLINNVEVFNRPDQPVVVYYEGCNGRPWKPSKGMIRVMGDSKTWGDDSDGWIGKTVLVYGDEKVKWAGKEEGGIRIKALSGIDKKGVDIYVAESRGKKRKQHFDCLDVTQVVQAVEKHHCPECGQPELAWDQAKTMFVCGSCKIEVAPLQ